jgi:hypothetical protein
MPKAWVVDPCRMATTPTRYVLVWGKRCHAIDHEDLRDLALAGMIQRSFVDPKSYDGLIFATSRHATPQAALAVIRPKRRARRPQRSSGWFLSYVSGGSGSGSRSARR